MKGQNESVSSRALNSGMWLRKGPLDRAPPSLNSCNICGSQEFTFGWRARGQAARPPQCARCKTVERHRIVRSIYSCLRPVLLSWRAFQFAPDGSVEPTWFAGFQSSVFDSANSVDMMDTGFANGAFDLVISNHVLEHVTMMCAPFARLCEWSGKLVLSMSACPRQYIIGRLGIGAIPTPIWIFTTDFTAPISTADARKDSRPALHRRCGW